MRSCRLFLLVCLAAILSGLTSKAALKRAPKDATVPQQVAFYIKRLGDPKYVEYRKHDDARMRWYVAAEELGLIGSPAVGPLIEKLRTTKNTRERTITFYALLLAVQAPEISAALGQTLPDYQLSFPPKEDHARLKKLWLDWWATHGATVQKVASEQPPRDR